MHKGNARKASMLAKGLVAIVLGAMCPESAAAAGAYEIAGEKLGVIWALPFAGLLLSIALFPLFAPSFWHHHYGKVAAFWALAFLAPYAANEGVLAALYQVNHTALLEYIPFVIILMVLFTVSGGIVITGNIHGAPLANTTILAIGTLLASLIGTTGASMVLIRPLIRANDNRRYNAHVIVFFIFLVSNIGGSLTPLGDPPLFLGYLKGISFFWTTKYMLAEMIFCAVILLGLFFVIDKYYYQKEMKEEGHLQKDPSPDTDRIGVKGALNLGLLVVVIGAVLMSGSWKPDVSFDLFGTKVELQNLVRDAILVIVTLVSYRFTPHIMHHLNGFNWGPVIEVAKLFAGIFITIIPVIAMLKAGKAGVFGELVNLTTKPDGTPDNVMYFWLSGMLSSFLDNAPTYLVFFNLAGANPQELMTTLSMTLLAISCGSVFMGANTYIGNAPNFMVKAIAEEKGIKMPSFFGYMLWSGAILVPLFVLVTWVFFK